MDSSTHFTAARLGLFVLATTLAWAGCEIASADDPAAATGSMIPPIEAGVSACSIEPDGVCDLAAGERCDCEDCAETAFCVKDQCNEDLLCDSIEDACTCADCDMDPYCADPAMANCTDDGVCDSFLEGCLCVDCRESDICADNTKSCAGEAVDGICAVDEPCSCQDCFGLPKCLTCPVTLICTHETPCFCAGCAGDPYCSDPKSCVNDGICDAVDEGCVCADCLNIAECAGGGGGGSGGADGGA